MENTLNKLLVRQIKRHFGSIDNMPEVLKGIIQDIDNTYKSFEDDAKLLQNSIEISSQELRDAYQKQKLNTEKHLETINKVKEAIYALNPSLENESKINVSDSSFLFDSLIKLIEERNQVEEALQNERTLFRTIIDLLPDAIYVKDLNGRKLIANPKEVHFAGQHSESDIIGKTDFDLYPKDHAESALVEDNLVMLGGKSILNIQGTLTDNEGILHYLLVSKVPLRDVHGVINGLVGVSHDVTAQKLSEQALRESEVNFRTFFESIDDMVFIANQQGEIFNVNDSVSRHLGYSINELTHMKILDVHPANKRDEAKMIFRDMFVGKRDFCPLPLVRKDGTLVPVETRVWFGKWDGKDCVFGISKDLSKEQESLQKFNKIFENNPAPMAISAIPERVFTEVNQAFLAKTGYTKEEIIGKTSEQLGLFIQPEKHREISDELAESNYVHNRELKLKSKSNDILIGLFSGEIIESQLKSYFLTVMVDVTENKKLEEEIKLQNDFYNIISTVSGRLIQADSKQLENEINHSLALLGEFNKVDRTLVFELDAIKDEINNTFEWCAKGIKSEINSLQGLPFSLLPYWKRAFLNNEHVFIESVADLPVERADEKQVLNLQGIQSVVTVPMFYGSSFIGFIGFDSVLEKKHWNEQVIILLKIYASILAGVIFKKKTEAALLKAKQEAEAANKSKSLFLANMSHEIRTPLNAIIGFSQLMNRDRQLSNIQKEYNLSIVRAGEHLLALINDILVLSKVESGSIMLNPSNIDLYSLFDDIQILFKDKAQAKHLQLTIDVADNVPHYVTVDDSKLRQIFINLIGNAIKFTDKGNVTVRAHTKEINDESCFLIVEVEDTGPGISNNEIGNLFKHFVQTSSGMKKGSGTGLGLVLSRELALIMGGDITVSSQYGTGSVFTIKVIIKKGEIETVERNNLQRVICIDKGEEVYRILVVDDKEENLYVATNLLKLVGFEVNQAINGEDAITKFENWNPHLILMDMRMPVMDGYEATRRIKATEKGKYIPIIALTASTFEDETEKMRLLEMQDFLRKPFRENELYSAIGKALGISYVYEAEDLASKEGKYDEDDEEFIKDIHKLPIGLKLQMINAVSAADFDLLIELIDGIKTDNTELIQHLLFHARNYDYDYLLEIFNQKEN